ncbi:MAG: hypothetical protein CMO34_05665 [Verrucomicrobia bacterium]|nr:hypothetical protein [Verrucomicrobiota bacterium]
MNKWLATLSLLLLLPICKGQEAVGINNDNPHASSILDISSTTQGVLVPRMTTGQRNSIGSPATGLLVFDSSTSTFWYFNGSTWVEIVSSVSTNNIQDADGDTRVQVEEGTDEDIIRFDLGGTEYFRMDGPRFEFVNNGNSVFLGQNAGQNDDLTNNNVVFVGTNAGRQNTSGSRNVGVGYRALQQNTTGNDNVGIGEDALRLNATGSFNIAVGANALDAASSSNNNIALGYNSLSSLVTGTDNVAVGQNSIQDLTTGSSNVALGAQALQNNTSGSENTALGRQAGQNSLGSRNIFIGYQAGRNETGNDKLYIESSSSTTPLIYGDFATDVIDINGDLNVTGDITYVGTITDVSDRRLKENIKSLNDVLPSLMNLTGYSYSLKKDKEKNVEFGFIAQEVLEYFPNLVKEVNASKGYLGVSYVQMIPLLLQALKEQQNIIEHQEKRLSKANNTLNELNAEVDQLLNKAKHE